MMAINIDAIRLQISDLYNKKRRELPLHCLPVLEASRIAFTIDKQQLKAHAKIYVILVSHVLRKPNNTYICMDAQIVALPS